MPARHQYDAHGEKTIREIRAAVGQALAATLARRPMPIAKFVARSGVSRSSFYAFLAGGDPTIRLLDQLARSMGLRLQVSLVPARLRACTVTADPLDIKALNERGVAGKRQVEAIGLLVPVPPAIPSDELVSTTLAQSPSAAAAARKLKVSTDWFRKTGERLGIIVPRPNKPLLSPAEQRARLEKISAGLAAGLTYREIGAQVGLSYERIRQIAGDQLGLPSRRKRRSRRRAKA